MNKAKAVYSTRESVEEAVRDVAGQLEGFETRALIFFASPRYGPEIGEQLQAAFRNATVFGCTTAGEIVSGKMLRHSVVAMALGPAIVRGVKVAVIENLKAGVNVRPAIGAFEAHFKVSASQMDLQKYVGVVLVDGMSGAEEMVMDQIGDLTDVTFVGGAAGDDLAFKATRLYAGGNTYSDAVLLALFRLEAGFDLIKTQSFKALDKRLVVTRAGGVSRAVAEFDGRPAVITYAEALGIHVADLPGRFMHNPVGIMLNDEPYVRSPQRLEGTNIVFYCNLPEGMEVTLLESGNIIRDTRAALMAKTQELGPIAGIINFDCILRTQELEKAGLAEAYGELFSDVPTVGFSTYGEEYIGHINQTATMLVLL